MLGVFADLPGKNNAQSVGEVERQIARPLTIDSHYYDWSDPFPGALEAADVASGRIPAITWWGTRYSSILNGSQDALIRKHASELKSFGHPVFLRWAAEMNGDWFAWGGTANGNDPAAFVAAWRRIHDIFDSVGVTNVAWVWAPNADSKPGGVDLASWNNWRNYYPGDDYVDWVGIDGYNRGGSYWQSFGDMFEPVYRDYAARKPIMIAESASVEDGGSKSEWIRDAGAWIKTHRAVKALIWFDTNRSSSGIDWRIDSSQSSLGAFATLANDPYFGG
jgi:hypothetical protein